MTTAPALRRALPVLWSVLLAAVLLWPLRHSGLPLGRDMVFTPHPPLGWDAAGWVTRRRARYPSTRSSPLLTHVAGAPLLSRLALLLPLVLAGTGAAVLLGTTRPVAGVVAATFAIWNPYVVQRLAMGDWSLLWAYAALPWLLHAVRRWRGGWSSTAVVVLWVAAASITPTGGVFAVVVVIVLAASRTSRAAGLLVAALALQLCWVLPALVGTASATSDAAGVAAFAARADHPGGALLSLLGGGGAWNEAAAPDSRGHWPAWVGLAVLVAAIALGWGPAGDVLGTRLRARLAGLAAGGVVLAAAGSTPGLDAALRAIVRDVPGGGLLRDAQKWLLPYVLFVAVLAGCAVTRVTGTALARAGAGLAALTLPFLTLPDAARPVHAVVAPVPYPADWAWAARAVRTGGQVAVLPFQPYRTFAWAPGRPVLDPAPRLLPAGVVVSDRLTVGGRTLAGEDEHAARVGRALRGRAAAARLARLGVGWVLVERGTPGPLPRLDGLREVRSGPALRLYRVPGTVAHRGPSDARVTLVFAGDAAALLVLIGAASFAVAGQGRLLMFRRRAGSEEN